MPFTKAPSISTNSSERMDFVYNAQARSAYETKDAKLTNVMIELLPSPEKENSRVVIKSRPGIVSAYTLSGGTPRGLYYWYYNGAGYVFSVVGSDVRVNGVTKATLTTSTGMVGFTEHVDSTGTVTLFMCDGTKGYLWANPSTAPTMITDVDFPSPHIPMPIFLDGYIFVAKANTEDIYNSDLNAPLSWTAGNFISAEMYPDNIIALSKNNNYIYAIGRVSTEYFYDAAIVNGSPLQREASAVQQFGTAAAGTVVQTEKEVIFVGNTGNGGATVWTIDGFKEKEISTPTVRAILLKEGSLLSGANASCIRVASQKLYILSLTSTTLVYSFENEMWTEWASGISAGENFIGNTCSDGPDGNAYILLDDGTAVVTMSETIYTDLGNPIYCVMTTPKYDFGTMNQKTMSRLSLIGDIPSSSSSENRFSIQWTDDDYQTYSLNRTLTMSRDTPYIMQLGRFRRRAFRINFSSPKLMRLDGIEVDINKGNT